MEQSAFVVSLHKLPPEGLDLSFAIDDPARAGIALGVPVDGPVRARFDVQRVGGEIRVSGTVSAAVRVECSRCLVPFVLNIESDANVTFAPPAQVAGEEHQRELAADELEIEPLVQGGADLRRVIAEQIHLALPLKPLCSEDCRGICPHCGQEAGACGCAPAGADPRWEALRKLTVS